MPLKDELLKLLREDTLFRNELRNLLIGEEVATKNDIATILTTINHLREDFNRMNAELKQLREDFNRESQNWRTEMNKLREDFNRMNAELKQLREDFQQESLFLRNEMKELSKRLEVKLTAIGGRWGPDTEATLRNALREFASEALGLEIKRWEEYDSEGIVYGHKSMVEVDIAIQNGEHFLIEFKARAGRSDVSELLRIKKLYEKKVGITPKLYLVATYVDEDAWAPADRFGVKIITYTLTSEKS